MGSDRVVICGGSSCVGLCLCGVLRMRMRVCVPVMRGGSGGGHTEGYVYGHGAVGQNEVEQASHLLR